MSDSMQIIGGLLFLVAAYILAQVGVNWRIRRASLYVIKDLKRRGAVNAASAVELPYAGKKFITIGLRDFRRRSLEELVANGFLGKTAEGKFYLQKDPNDVQSFLSGSKAGG